VANLDDEFLAAIDELEPRQLAAVLARCASRLAAASPANDDHLIDVKEAAQIMGVSEGYIRARKHKLPFIVRVGNRLMCSYIRIQEYIGKGKSV
jgi:hypothetical protein